MIEPYKQRLISQANGVENSPLIDMCLVSYKHGVNETLDTLKLSNLVRIGKNSQEESITEELEEAANKYAVESYPDEPSIGQFGTGDYEPYVDMSGQRECAVEDFKAGVEWQREQMKEALRTEYEKGRHDALEEIKKSKQC